jgi:hypothetical protein
MGCFGLLAQSMNISTVVGSSVGKLTSDEMTAFSKCALRLADELQRMVVSMWNVFWVGPVPTWRIALAFIFLDVVVRYFRIVLKRKSGVSNHAASSSLEI